jgi:DeoR family transcriptional regulator, suf operon transcriptional repressor
VKTTRQQIREYLQDKQSSSADELARALRVTPANIRHHLSVLISDGLVEKFGERPSLGRGRPVQLYGLSETRSRHNLVLLLNAILSEFRERSSSEEYFGFIHSIAKKLSKNGLITAKNRGQRYYQVIQFLNSMNYQARWEAHANAPHVIFSHCPYSQIIQDHPELCQVDADLLQELLGERAFQAAKLEPTLKGNRQCVFLVGRSTSATLNENIDNV